MKRHLLLTHLHNSQNDRFVRFSKEGEVGQGEGPSGDPPRGNTFVTKTKHPAGAMFLGVIASTGEVGPQIWWTQGYRLTAEGYIDVLRTKVVPWMRKVAEDHGLPFVFQQDSAPAHIAKSTTKFLQEENIPFWPRMFWPPNSPDLAPLDFGIWPMVVQRGCKTRAKSVTVLKRRVGIAWRSLEPEKIRAICRKFRPRLEECVRNKGKKLL